MSFIRINKGVPAMAAGITLLMAVSGCALGSPSAQEVEEGGVLKIGMVSSLTGPAAAYGVPMANGVHALVDHYNKTSDVKIELVVRDDKTDPTKGAQSVTELIHDEGVEVLVGPLISNIVQAAAPIAAENKVPMLSPTSTANITDRTKNDWAEWLFITTATDSVVAPGYLQRAAAEGAKDVAIIYEETASGNAGFKLIAEEAQNHPEVAIVESVAVAPTATDFTAQATKIVSKKPDAIIVGISTIATAAGAVKAIRQADPDVIIYGNTGMANKSFIDAAGKDAEGLRLSAFVLDADPNPKVANLLELIKGRGDTPAGGFSDVAMASAIDILVATVERTGEYEGEAIRNALESGTPLETLYDEAIVYTKDDHDGITADGMIRTVVRDGDIIKAE